MLDNGLKNGAYNLDKVNDAINEVTTRLVDGTIGESIGSFSTKTQELFTSWQNGGATPVSYTHLVVYKRQKEGCLHADYTRRSERIFEGGI